MTTRYIMSIVVSNCQHYDEQQFQTQSCVHYTILSVPSSKVRFIYTSTVTGSDSCSGKNYAYALVFANLFYFIYATHNFSCVVNPFIV